MKRVLSFVKSELYHTNNGEKKIGDCSMLSGDCTGLRGDCSMLRGDCTGLRGDCTGLRGDCTRLSGDLDTAKITKKERERGVAIADLIKKDTP